MNTSWLLDIRSVLADDAFQVVVAWIGHGWIVIHAVVFVLADFRLENFLKNQFSIKSVDSQSHQPKNVLLIIMANVILLWIIKILLSIALVNDLIGTKKKLL